MKLPHLLGLWSGTSRILAALALGVAAGAVAAADDDPPVLEGFVAGAPWSTDYAAALARARAEQKPVLLNFTGSDWCVWCHRLRDEVFSQRHFIDYARENLVLVELDFPRNKPQAGEEKAQNRRLQEEFNVSGYPTVILVDADGRELGRTGYMQGGPKTFVRELRRFAAKAAPPSKES